MLETWKLAENTILAHGFSWLVKNTVCWMFVICSLRCSLKSYFLMRCWTSLITIQITGSLPMGVLLGALWGILLYSISNVQKALQDWRCPASEKARTSFSAATQSTEWGEAGCFTPLTWDNSKSAKYWTVSFIMWTGLLTNEVCAKKNPLTGFEA